MGTRRPAYQPRLRPAAEVARLVAQIASLPKLLNGSSWEGTPSVTQPANPRSPVEEQFLSWLRPEGATPSRLNSPTHSSSREPTNSVSARQAAEDPDMLAYLQNKFAAAAAAAAEDERQPSGFSPMPSPSAAIRAASAGAAHHSRSVSLDADRSAQAEPDAPPRPLRFDFNLVPPAAADFESSRSPSPSTGSDSPLHRRQAEPDSAQPDSALPEFVGLSPPAAAAPFVSLSAATLAAESRGPPASDLTRSGSDSADESPRLALRGTQQAISTVVAQSRATRRRHSDQMFFVRAVSLPSDLQQIAEASLSIPINAGSVPLNSVAMAYGADKTLNSIEAGEYEEPDRKPARFAQRNTDDIVVDTDITAERHMRRSITLGTLGERKRDVVRADSSTSVLRNLVYDIPPPRLVEHTPRDGPVTNCCALM